MSSPLLVLGVALRDGTAAGVTVCVGCYMAGRTEEIAAGWSAGCAWAAERTAQVSPSVRARVERAELWVLERALRAHGRHRAVTA